MFAPWSGINFSLAAGVSLMNIGKLRLDTFLHEIRGQVSKFLEINKIILYFRIICIRFIKQSPFSSIHKTRKIGICSCNVSLSPVSLLKQESIAGCQNWWMRQQFKLEFENFRYGNCTGIHSPVHYLDKCDRFFFRSIGQITITNNFFLFVLINYWETVFIEINSF